MSVKEIAGLTGGGVVVLIGILACFVFNFVRQGNKRLIKLEAGMA